MRRRECCLAALVLMGTGWTAPAAVIHVRPGQSIGRAARRAGKGATVAVRAGLYRESDIIPNHGVRVVSADGPGRARVDAGGKGKTFFLWRRNDVVVDGFECFNSGENVVMVTASKNCVLRNLYVHDAGTGGDCIKINAGTEDLLVENCVTHSPGAQPGRAEVEECIDIMTSSRVTIRGCWLYYTGREARANQLGYSKCDCFDIVWENNVFGPTHRRNEVGDAALGGGWAGENKSGWNTVGIIYRNNLFIDCHHGALGIYGQKDVRIVNNTFVNSGRLGKDIIDIHEGGKAKHSENIRVYNNIFVDFEGKMPRQGVLSKTNGTWKDIVNGGNIYWNAGKSIPSSRLLSPRKEPGARFVDPGLVARALPEITGETTRESLMKLFGPRPGSPAIDAAVKLDEERLQVAADAFGTERPQGLASEIGAVELKVERRPPASKAAVSRRPIVKRPLAGFEDGIAASRQLAGSGNFEGAKEKAAELARGAGEERARRALEALSAGFGAAGRLREIVIERHTGRRPTVYVDLAGRPARGKVVAADDEGVVVSVLGADVRIPWSRLKTGRLVRMAAKFTDETDADEHLAIARFAAAMGLKEEAEAAIERFLAAAPGEKAEAEIVTSLVE